MVPVRERMRFDLESLHSESQQVAANVWSGIQYSLQAGLPVGGPLSSFFFFKSQICNFVNERRKEASIIQKNNENLKFKSSNGSPEKFSRCRIMIKLSATSLFN